jgi:hypothetical protein
VESARSVIHAFLVQEGQRVSISSEPKLKTTVRRRVARERRMLSRQESPYRLQTPHVPPSFAQCLQYRQFLHALHGSLPVHVAHVWGRTRWRGFALAASDDVGQAHKTDMPTRVSSSLFIFMGGIVAVPKPK